MLWVLRRPADARAPEHVLMVDTATRPVDFARVAADAWARFDRGEHADEPGVSTAVPVVELLDDAVDLTPARYLVPPAEDLTPERITAEGEKIATLLRATADLIPAVEALGESGNLPTVPLAELERRGMLTIHQSMSAANFSLLLSDLPFFTLEELLGEKRPDDVAPPSVLAQHVIAVEPGDVLVTQHATRLIALVVANRCVVPGPRVTLLRPDPERLDPHFLAGFVSGSTNVRHYTGTGSRLFTDIRRAEIPLLPIEEQRAYGEAFRRLTDFGRDLRHAAAMGEDLIRLISDGLTQRIVRPAGTHTNGTR